MTEYLVIWKIDIPAADPKEAVEKAREIQLDEGSTATFFEVIDPEMKKRFMVELSENIVKEIPYATETPETH